MFVCCCCVALTLCYMWVVEKRRQRKRFRGCRSAVMDGFWSDVNDVEESDKKRVDGAPAATSIYPFWYIHSFLFLSVLKLWLSRRHRHCYITYTLADRTRAALS